MTTSTARAYNRRVDRQSLVDAAEERNSDAVWSSLDAWGCLEVCSDELRAAIAGHDVALVELELARCSTEVARLRLLATDLAGDVKAADKFAREYTRLLDRFIALEKAQ